VLTDRGDVLFIQFAREPRAGAVKTRMQPALSARQACSLHSDLLLWTCRSLCEAKLADVELWIAGGRDHAVFERCETLGITTLYSQRGADLGERMASAMADGLARYRKVILVGSDCPAIDSDYLQKAIAALDTQPLVLGPASDGGYVLIGATRIQAAIFAGVSWGSSQVFTETVQRIVEEGSGWCQLSTLSDIDRPEDLPQWRALSSAGRVSLA